MSASAKLNAPPTKILLSQSTNMSLNDRFSQLAKTRRTKAPTMSTIKNQPNGKIFNKNNTNNNGNRNGNLFQKNASAKNRRLALQMANRPSVQAALKLKKKSIRQRLGTAGGAGARINNRIGGNGNGNRNGGPGNNSLRQRIGNGGGIRRRTNIYSRLSGLRRGRNGRRGGNNALTRRNLKARLGNIVNNNGANNGSTQQTGLNTSLNKRRNAIINAGGVRGNTRVNNRGNRRPNRGGNNNNNNRRRGGGNRRGGMNRSNPQQQTPKSKESLDSELDQYMAKSKTNLNADLDQYMSQAH